MTTLAATKRVRFVNPGKLYETLRTELDQAFVEVMSRGDLVDRQQLRSFEQDFAEFVGTRYAVGLNSGYDALHLSLRAAGVGHGDEVIVPAHTFVATASAVVNAGATPVLVDVRQDFNIDPDLIEPAITARTRAIIPVHLNGRMVDMRRVEQIAERHNLVIIEDACQSLGATQFGRRAGSIGLTGCWSFYPFKLLGGYGDGGAITTDDPDVAQFVSRMRFNGEDRETGNFHGHGFTCILDNLQAALLNVKLRYVPAWIQRRQQIAELYRVGLSNLPSLALPHFDTVDQQDVYQNYVVCSADGDAFVEHMQSNGIEVLVQWRKPYYTYSALGLIDRGFPQTERLSAQVCSLPMCVELDDDEVRRVIEVARAFYAA